VIPLITDVKACRAKSEQRFCAKGMRQNKSSGANRNPRNSTEQPSRSGAIDPTEADKFSAHMPII
jgi:hypothetical protein